MSAPSVTVVVPVFNSERHIADCLESLLAQKLTGLQIICVDDGSSDGGCEIIARYRKRHAQIRLIKLPQNMGQGHARNVGLDAADGRYIQFVDSDDLLTPNAIRELLDLAEADGADAVKGRFSRCDALGRPMGKVQGTADEIQHAKPLEDLPQLWNFSSHCCFLFRLDRLRASGVRYPEDMRNGQDTAFLIELLPLLQRISTTPAQVYFYRMSAASISRGRRDLKWYRTTLGNYARAYARLTALAHREIAHHYFLRAFRWRFPDDLFPTLHAQAGDAGVTGVIDDLGRLVRQHGVAQTYFGAAYPWLREGALAAMPTACRFLIAALADGDEAQSRRLVRSFEPDAAALMPGAKLPGGPMLRIAIARYGLTRTLGGAERSCVLLANALRSLGHRVHIFASNEDPAAQPVYDLDDGVFVTNVPFQRNSACLLKAQEFTSAWDPDVFVTMTAGRDLLFWALALHALRIPHLVSERNNPTLIEQERWDATERRACLSVADGIHLLVPSYADAVPLSSRDDISIIPSPAPLSAVAAQPGALDRQPLVVCVARLHDGVKQQSLLLKAFALASRKVPGWRLELWGDGPDRALLMQSASALGLDAEAIFRGQTSDIESVYRRASVCCLPSRYEGMPRVVMEAMAHGLPMVAFADCSGTSDLVQDGETGLLAAQMTAESLASALIRLMQDSDLRNALGVAARRALDAYEPCGIYARWEQLLRHTARKKPTLKRFRAADGALRQAQTQVKLLAVRFSTEIAQQFEGMHENAPGRRFVDPLRLTSLSGERLADVLEERIRAGKPFAFTRFGEGEATFLLDPDVLGVNVLGERLSYYFGTASLPVAEVRFLHEEMQQALLSTDIVGIPSVERFERMLASDGWSEWRVRYRELYNVLRRTAFPAGTLFASLYAPYELHLSGRLFRILDDLDEVGLITSQPVADSLSAIFGLNVLHHPIPERAVDREEVVDTGHYPRRFFELMQEIRHSAAGRVVIIGAGPLGKLYARAVKNAGGMALDLGGLLDAWCGHITRPNHYRTAQDFAATTGALIGNTEERTVNERLLLTVGNVSVLTGGELGKTASHLSGPTLRKSPVFARSRTSSGAYRTRHGGGGASHPSRHTDNCEKQLQRLQRQIDAISNSMSWRITYPLRTTVDWLKRQRRRGKA
jgi:glycosyltransferase involved in cell wall biosynthesis